MSIDFEKYAREGNLFIKELAQELGDAKDTAKSGRILKTLLHVLRNHLTVTESIQLLAQFPPFLKAIYVDGWTLKKKKRIKRIDDFIQEVMKLDYRNAEHDFPGPGDVERAFSLVFMALRKYVSLGELEDVKAILPKELKSLFPSVIMI